MTRNELKMYPRLKKRHEYLKSEIKRLKYELTSIKSPQITDDPSGGERKGLDDKLAEIEECELKVMQIERRMEEIEKAIASVPDELGQEMLALHYIEDNSWLEVGCEIGYSKRQVHRLVDDLFVLKTS